MNYLAVITAAIASITGPFASHSGPEEADKITIYYDSLIEHDSPQSSMEYEEEEPMTVEEFLSASEGTAFPDTYSQPYDSLVVALQERKAQEAFDAFFNEFINIERVECSSDGQLPDSVYEARLKMLMSPVNMTYNDVVKRYIISYTTRMRPMMEKILARSQYYFPMIEEELDREGLPIELRMLPVVESALTPTAISYAGASGLWQFMYTTGKVYGLEINSFVDQRRDPLLSTKAACRYLKDLYGIYGDWSLALAAYNCGPGNVNKAIRRAGSDSRNFWDIYPYLPSETRGYVPSFIAATYAYAFHYHHDIEPAESSLPLATDTVMISRPTHFGQITSSTHIPAEVLRTLNPQYKADIIPAAGKSYALTLPLDGISQFIDNEEAIYAKDTVYLAQYVTTSKTDPSKKIISFSSYTYKVRSGDTLSDIAKKHHVTVAQLMKWNNIKNAHRLRVGQRLEIYR